MADPGRDGRPRPRFHTDFVFRDRASKARYVALKYESILTGEVLDVGADECHLAAQLPAGVRYVGIGLGGRPDVEHDLELGRLPFADDRFHCVLCLDVLEHLENVHAIFDELCRVARRHVVISLPNPYRELYAMLRDGDYGEGQHLKFYGLPVEPPPDRHRWFFSSAEARAFVEYRAKRNGMRIVQLDAKPNSGRPRGLRRRLEPLAHRVLFGRHFDPALLWTGPLWVVLEKGDAPSP